MCIRDSTEVTTSKNQRKENLPMAKRKRNIQILFCVSPEEKKLIRRKMIESKTKNMGAYLRKMAIDGYIVNTDTTPLKKQYEEMHKIGVNKMCIRDRYGDNFMMNFHVNTESFKKTLWCL